MTKQHDPANNNKASIREVYEIVSRMEEKLDLQINGLGTRVNNLETRMTAVETVKTLVYGMVGLVLTSVVGALLALVLRVKQ